ncbi:DUF4870 domain-containing protein [Anaerolinea thermophila]|uniref:Hypothetical membrane protein n=1 Tax=Anaerolinea thermophila (strain DSM 14523 / JCM 11388 / NBRC 100420 / UNI-1) TaxID=926569 RepID=E8N3A3_ANATU|nr:hypothetical protein [Anaerolinea thermophila]BAJ62917.1 hypothetical membrane protein [Anaerolinea thermophila UNI-1]
MDRSRITAFLSYLILFLGSLYVLIFERRDDYARYHALQALGLVFFSAGVFLGWVVLGFLLAWIPIIGPVLSASLFALVIAAWIFAVVAWVMGMVNATRGLIAPLPLIGRWAEKLPF